MWYDQKWPFGCLRFPAKGASAAYGRGLKSVGFGHLRGGVEDMVRALKEMDS